MGLKEIEIGNYGEGKTKQHNTVSVSIGDLTIYFSYKTPVAFQGLGWPLTVRENDWGPTTGKHLNWLDGGNHKQRYTGKEFEKMLKDLLSQHGLTV